MTPNAIDLAFPVIQGLIVPIDHGHCLLGALKQAAPALAEVDPLGVIPLRGQPLPANLLHLSRGARLRLRFKPEAIPLALALAGKELRVGSHLIRLGAPTIEVLAPHPVLAARLVVIAKTVSKEQRGEARGNRFATEAEILAAVKAKINVGATVRSLGHRSLLIHGTRIAGIGVVVEGLDDAASLRLQCEGVGGRRAFGCGLFVQAGPVPRDTVATASAGDEVGHA
jgi:CRISPR-associated protein Cas6